MEALGCRTNIRERERVLETLSELQGNHIKFPVIDNGPPGCCSDTQLHKGFDGDADQT